MTERVILLDWDGVFNAAWYDIRNEPRDVEAWSRLGIYEPDFGDDHYQVLVDRTAVERFNRIAAMPDIRVFWLTAAGWHVPRTMAPWVGLDDFPQAYWAPEEPGQVGWPDSGFRSMFWWKSEAVREIFARTADTGTEFLWVDDSISGDLQHHMGRDGRISYLIPDSRRGLLPGDLDAIEMWATTGGFLDHNRHRIDTEARDAQDRLDHPEDYADDGRDKLFTSNDEAVFLAAAKLGATDGETRRKLSRVLHDGGVSMHLDDRSRPIFELHRAPWPLRRHRLTKLTMKLMSKNATKWFRAQHLMWSAIDAGTSTHGDRYPTLDSYLRDEHKTQIAMNGHGYFMVGALRELIYGKADALAAAAPAAHKKD